MKLFQRLLVAPAALGLLAPLASNAAELKINDVSNYSSETGTIDNISQFSDVYPTDWAYQALTSLVTRHGCTAASPSGSMTRYEAAALLNSCLGEIAELNEEEQRLVNEFGQELAVIKGRVEAFESEMGFEAGMFSSTTKMHGDTTFILGGVSQDGSNSEATTFTYKTEVGLDTSFQGDDLLVTRIAAGNIADSDPFGCSGSAALEVCEDTSGNLQIDRLYYQFPLGGDFTATVGPQVRQDDMLGVWPSDYPSDTILDVLTYAGANATYALAKGAGAGVTYANDNISASVLFVSKEAADASTGSQAGATSGGVLTSGGADDITAQLAWVGEGFTIAAAYTYADNGNIEDNSYDTDDYSAYGISGVYQIDNDSVFIPSSVSAGFGWKNPDNTSKDAHVTDETTWTVGLLWDNVGYEGNTLGFAYGTAAATRDDIGNEPTAVELFYSMAVSDSITVTPALFRVSKDEISGENDVTGALVKTTFNF